MYVYVIHGCIWCPGDKQRVDTYRIDKCASYNLYPPVLHEYMAAIFEHHRSFGDISTISIFLGDNRRDFMAVPIYGRHEI